MDFHDKMRVARNGAFGGSNEIHERDLEENEKIKDFDAGKRLTAFPISQCA